MRFVLKFVRQCLGVSLLGTMSIGSLSSYPSNPDETVREQKTVRVPLNSSLSEQNRTAELFARMTVRHHWQEAHLDRLSTIRTYNVENDKGKTVAEEVVVMEYKAPRTETFASTSEKGSGFVLHHVFQRLMKDEEQRVRTNKDPDSLITPENYTLVEVGMDRIRGFDCSIVHAIPRRKETDLFDGRIWIDNQDFAIVKISGHLAKSPSFWIEQVDFVRDYQKIGGFWLLSREEAISTVRIFGKEILTVDYQNYTVNGTQTLLSLSSPQREAQSDRR